MSSRKLRNEYLQKTFINLKRICNVKVHHCPSHVGIKGNECADALAEAAVKLDKSCRPRTIGMVCFMKIIKRSVLIINKKVNFFEEFKQNGKAIKILSRYYTKANALNDYLFSIKCSDSNKCKHCKKTRETLDHFMNVCPRYIKLRRPAIEKTWYEIFEYIQKTGRQF